MGKKLILMHGISGQGKSTLAKILYSNAGVSYPIDECIFSTDNKHMRFIGDEWVYTFQADKLHYFHKENQKDVFHAMSLNRPLVIVDNTNLTFEEVKPYVIGAYLYGYDLEFKEPETSWSNNADELASRNTHGVPIESIKRMLARKQAVSVLKSKSLDLMEHLKRLK